MKIVSIIICSALSLVIILPIQAALLSDRTAIADNADAVQKLIECRKISDVNQRYTCYDPLVAELEVAIANRQIIVVNKEDVKKARQGIFGFNLPNLGNIFGTGSGVRSEDDVTEIEMKIQVAQDIGYGNWLFTLENGAQWQQIGGSLALSPKVGQIIKIRRASLGSFIANVGKQQAIKVKRVN